MLYIMLMHEFDQGVLGREFKRIKYEDIHSINSDDYYYTNRGLGSYDSLLPSYKGQSFLDFLTSRINQSEVPIDILDLGCGQGRALAEILQRFPGKVRVVGISATDLRQHLPSQLQSFANQIDLRVGEIHDLLERFGKKRFDVIMSVKTFEHLEYPEYVVQRSSELLKPNGLTFIDGPEKLVLTPSQRGIAA